ncbi:MAG: twin-arginine translocation signal domain-containing protein [Oleiphilaceae bacterium]
MAISRRDFLNGVALTIAAGLTPLSMLRANPESIPAITHWHERQSPWLVRSCPQAGSGRP